MPRTRDALEQLLARTFPHSQDIDPATVDAFVDGLMRLKTERSASAPAPARPAGLDERSLFTLHATHARRTPITAVFTGVTQAVRVRLPEEQPVEIETPIGDVLADDHLLPSVRAVRERFGERISGGVERVELLTPARSTGIRFAPMSLYFGYARERDENPSFVVYEPGDALGKPGALYFAATLETVVEERAGYKPTPLSSPDHWYTGGLRMAPNGRDPAVLFMHAAAQRGGEPHFRLHVEYVPDLAEGGSPIGDLVEAALRMLAVQKGAGTDQGAIERLVAETGLLLLPWIDRPDNQSAPRPAGLPESAEIDEGKGPPRAPSSFSEERFEPSRDFDPFLAELEPRERASLQASLALLLGAVVRADGKLDRLERIEIDWIMNFAVPSALGDAFRFSEAAAGEYEAVLAGTAATAGPKFEWRLAELGAIVERLPEDLRERYTNFVVEMCRDAAEASGGWLWFGSKVGPEEKRALDQIAAALGLESA
ncbi:MAG: DUF1365 family protein [Enhygromyxa sp.]